MKPFKKLAVHISILFFIISSFSFSAYASELDSHTTEYTITVDLQEIPSLERTSTKTGKKTYTCSDSDGLTIWTYSVYGKFSYDGTTATCINVTDTYSLLDPAWHIASHSTSKSSNQAIGSAVFNEIRGGNIVNAVPITVTITCSPDGTLQ